MTMWGCVRCFLMVGDRVKCKMSKVLPPLAGYLSFDRWLRLLTLFWDDSRGHDVDKIWRWWRKWTRLQGVFKGPTVFIPYLILGVFILMTAVVICKCAKREFFYEGCCKMNPRGQARDGKWKPIDWRQKRNNAFIPMWYTKLTTLSI